MASIAHKPGRIAFDDLQSERSYAPQRAYQQSKLADLMFALTLDRKLKATGSKIQSIAVHPGVAQSALFKIGNSQGFSATIERAISTSVGLLLNDDKQGAVPTIFAATSPQATGGSYYGPQGFMEMRGGDVGPAKIAPPGPRSTGPAKTLATLRGPYPMHPSLKRRGCPISIRASSGLRWGCSLLFLINLFTHPAQTQTITRLQGTDPTANIQYVLLTLPGKLIGPATPETTPTLTAQCTQTPDGKQHFELLASLGPPPATLTYIPPWRPTRDEQFEPATPRLTVSMEFLGYVKEKPVKRQWKQIAGLPGEVVYNPPGQNSSNLEPITFYLQYMRSLPTLHLTALNSPDSATRSTAEFLTQPWQTAIHTEPLCRASGL